MRRHSVTRARPPAAGCSERAMGSAQRQDGVLASDKTNATAVVESILPDSARPRASDSCLFFF